MVTLEFVEEDGKTPIREEDGTPLIVEYSDEEYKQIESLADAMNLDVESLIIEAIRKYLEDIEKTGV